MPLMNCLLEKPYNLTTTLDRAQGRASLDLGSADHRASAEDTVGLYTLKRHTPSPKVRIKIPDPTRNQTRTAGY